VIYVTVETVVRRRPEVVWAFLTDVSSLPAWIEGVVEARIAGAAKEGVGLEVDVVRRTGRRRSRATCEVTAWREPELLALETRAGDILLLDRAVLEPVEEGTKLGVYAELALGGTLASLFARPQGMLGGGDVDLPIQGIYERSVASLVKRIETSSTAPYR
jgi:uncharacterized protein YndB with AHSA1/START domain